MSSASPRVALVVVNFRSADLTGRLLTSCAGGADEVIVVDCTPGESGLVSVVDRAGARLVDPGRNLGYGAGANLGAREVDADVLVVANPDVEIDGAALRQLAALAHGVGLVAPRFTFPDGRLQRSAHLREPTYLSTLFELSVPVQALARRVRSGWHPTLVNLTEPDRSLACSHVLGALMAIDMSAFRSVGGFDESFFLYREETDLCRRLRHAGWAVRHEPVVSAVHALGGSSTTDHPLITKPEYLVSHYHYISRHWGRPASAAARLIGLLASVTSAFSGPDRPAWRRAVSWHLGRR